jgi:hypothetical protein
MKCILIGYSDEKKGYRLLSNGKFIISRDVVFDETKIQTTGEIDNLLSHLEKKVAQEKTIYQGKPNWIEKDLAPNMNVQELDNSSSDDESSIQDRSTAVTSPQGQHNRPKWFTQLLKDVHPDEQDKTRTRSSTSSQSNFSLVTHDSIEPTTFAEAMKHKEWQQAMVDEYDLVIANGTWKLVDCPTNVKPIDCKWVYRIKYKANGEVDKYKARLVQKDLLKEGIDYEETFSPTTKWNTIRMVINLAAQYGWTLHQMDVKSAFLNGDLKEEVYMTQPLGFEVEGKEHKVCKLIKALYGLKQAPRAWYAKMDEYLRHVGFHRSESDDTLYYRMQGQNLVIIVLYVDDLIITGNYEDHIKQVKQELQKGFKMTDLGPLRYYLGVEVSQQRHQIFLNQTKYATYLLKKFGMENCKPSLTPMEKNLKLSKFEGGELVNSTKL